MVKKPSIKDRAMAVTAAAHSAAPSTPSVVAPPAASGITEGSPPPTLQSTTQDTPPAPNLGKPKTGPGSFMNFMAKESEVFQENQQLKDELKGWEGSLPTKLLDPKLVSPSEWANRHEDSFQGPDFAQTKTEIESAGGNIQPIKVRPIPGTEPQRYEIVFGHRRHRGCLELGLPVLAMIEAVDDRTLFEDMDRENRQRYDLRPYEQGVMYRRALDRKLYTSVRMLADSVGADHSNVGKAVKLAQLPEEVLSAFPSRLDLQYRWAQPLDDAVSKNPAEVVARAIAVSQARKAGQEISAAETYSRLLAAGEKAPTASERVIVGSRGSATIKEHNGRYSADFSKNSVTPELAAKLDEFISNMLNP